MLAREEATIADQVSTHVSMMVLSVTPNHMGHMATTTHNGIPVESETVEWKQSLGEWREIVETCAAFATSHGGVIYVGIDPKGERAGVQVGQRSLEDLANKIKVNTDPPQFPAIAMEGHERATLVRIQIEESPVRPVWAFGRPIKRVGRTNQCLRREEAHRLWEVSTGRTWDALSCPRFTLGEMDRKAVREYLEHAGMSLATPIEDLLRNIKLPFGPGAFCNAAVLLFGKSPQTFFVEAQLKCGRFKGTDSVDFDDEQTYEGSILAQLDDAMGFVGRHTRRAYRITGRPEREVTPEYPEDAVREALINALCHRDYAVVGTIQVRIYDDRMEIWNPGRLPPNISLRKLYQRHASHPGNPLIAQALYRARLIEHWGTGTLRIIEACQKAGIKAMFEASMGMFIVTLRKPRNVGDLISVGGRSATHEAHDEVHEAHDEAQVVVTNVEKSILTACQHGPQAARDLLAATGYKKRTGNFKRSLATLVEKQLLVMTLPDKPRSRLQSYRLTVKGGRILANAE